MKKTKILSPILPSSAIKAEYQRVLINLIRDMQASVDYFVKSGFKRVQKEIAEDTVPSALQDSAMDDTQRYINQIRRMYQKKFNALGKKYAPAFVAKIQKNVTTRLRRQLIDQMTVQVRMTPAMRAQLKGITNINVSLIKSIPQEYFKRVEQDVMGTVTEGRNITALTDKLQKTYGVTRNRAYFIAQDQVNKATEIIDREEKKQLGLYTAVWVHSSASRTPRQTHKRMNNKEYDIRKGMYDSSVGRYIQPAELPGCNCFPRTVIKI
jgi:uncharacterized protein with gpF-like domain